jgi:protein-tyrosine kinase
VGRIERTINRMKSQGDGEKEFSRPVNAAATDKAKRKPDRKRPDPDRTDLFDQIQRIVTLDEDRLRNNRVITEDMDSAVRTSYKMLRTRILQRMDSNGWHHLAVTSANQGDGKTITAINLAISLAGDVNHQVCLVDLDLRRSSIADYMGLEIEHGISDCLQRGLPLSQAIIGTNLERLVVLPNAQIEVHSSEILSSPRMQEITRSLGEKKNRIVVYDMPPVLAADDALSFSPLADAILFVVAESKTTRTDVTQAYELLDGIEILGSVLNYSNEWSGSYY